MNFRATLTAVLRDLLARIPLGLLVLLCLTLGLAPYSPPHIWEKLTLLARLELRRPLDWFDLLLHGVPWILLGLRAILRPRD